MSKTLINTRTRCVTNTKLALVPCIVWLAACNTTPRQEDPHPLANQVTNLINETTKSKRRQARAFLDLEALGRPAVPYVIRHLDDTRRLAHPYLRLENKASDAFEAFRQFGPRTVGQALPDVLNQMTGQIFYVGASSTPDRQAWRKWCAAEFGATACGSTGSVAQ